MTSQFLTGMFGSLAVTLTASGAHAQESDLVAQISIRNAADAEFARFAPGNDPIDHTIDYSVLDDVLSYVVFRMGKSLREAPGRPEPGLGSRRLYGHDSRFRLEGNRVLFSFFDQDLKGVFSEYRRDLEATAESLDISRLSRNEQLAFWINLHNVALVEQIALNWPIRQPREITIEGVPLDEARFISCLLYTSDAADE